MIKLKSNRFRSFSTINGGYGARYWTGNFSEKCISQKFNFLSDFPGLYLASFDAAVIVFEQYTRHNVFETFASLQLHIKDHYLQTFKGQITTLLGSLDILGNPMGLLQDFSSGVEGLLKKGNVGGLFVNVAHGMSNSAAKVIEVFLSFELFTHTLFYSFSFRSTGFLKTRHFHLKFVISLFIRLIFLKQDIFILSSLFHSLTDWFSWNKTFLS